MRKLFVVLAIVCLVGKASAQHRDGIGVYFDEEATSHCSGFVYNWSVDCYLIVTNSSPIIGISSWECHVDYTVNPDNYSGGWTLEGLATNLSVAPDFKVYLSLSEPLLPSSTIVLASYSITVLNTEPMGFRVREADDASIPGSPSYWSVWEVPLNPVAGDYPNAYLNGFCNNPLGTVVIDPHPDGLNAPWNLEGPGGPWSGSGSWTLPDMITGTYELTWGEDGDGAIPDPNPVYQVLPLGDTITFTGSYYDPPEWANLQWPAIMAAGPGGTSPDVFGRVFIDVITDTPGESSDIAAQLGVGPDGSDPMVDPDWQWFPAVYNLDYGLNDEYMANASAASLGLYDYCYRFSYKGGDWTYGDLNGSDDGYSSDQAGSFMVVAEPGWASLQRPPSTLAASGSPTPNIYGWVWLTGLTDLPGQGLGIVAELGYGPDGSNPSTDPSWQWTSAAYNMDVAANDEYVATITASTPGIYDYCFRYAVNGGSWVYGDLDGSGNGYSVDQAGSLEVVVGAEVGDWVWWDDNGNGIQDSGEHGESAYVSLFDSEDHLISTAEVDNSGLYSFGGLLPGDYYLVFDHYAGLGLRVSPWDVGDDQLDSDMTDLGRTAIFTLTAGQVDHSWDCGWYFDGSGVQDDEIPGNYALRHNVPNPFNPMTTIGFDLPKSDRVSLRIYDVSGKLVRILLNAEVVDAGRREATWRARDEAGRQVAAGVYFYRLKAGSFSETKRMVLLK